MSADAANHNIIIIESFNSDLNATIDGTSEDTQLEYDSEFRPTFLSRALTIPPPLWSRANILLEQGCSVPLQEIDPTIEKEDLTLGLKHGNHKGAIN